MKRYSIVISIFVFITSSFVQGYAQTTVTGKVVNNLSEPLPSASVIIKKSAVGTKTDSLGNFSLTVNGKGRKILIISSVGYHNNEMEMALNDSIVFLNITLQPENPMLNDVVVSAGSFEASDKAKGAALTPIDAVTVAGNGGDISNAMRALPGAQQIGEKEGLFVRGGTNEETKQFVDGTLLKNPNFSSVPGVPQYARLNPFLFKGILFSTGGYSALYGEALSSALILETVDLPESSSASFNLFPMNVGAGMQILSKDKKSSYGFTGRYGNFKFYNNVIKQKPDFFHGPEYGSGDANFRIKTSKTGMLKFYTLYSYSHTGMRNPDIDSNDLKSSFEVEGTNVYSNLSYKESLGNRWKIDAAVTYNFYKENLDNFLVDKNNKQVFLPAYPYISKNNYLDSRSDFAQARAVFTKSFAHNQAFRFGGEYFYNKDNYKHNDTLSKLNDHLPVMFAEGDIYIAPGLAAKAGLRLEHSSLLNKWNIALRIGMAYKMEDGGQVNIGYGIFYQKPENQYLVQNNELGFTSATHYIINYQKKAHNRFLRIEAYYKQYKNLVTTFPGYSSSGDGYAKGVELFFRDKKTIKNFDYWVTYTYLDTKRKFLDYPSRLKPSFATPHTVSIVGKKYFEGINLNVNFSYTLATGRPYYDIRMDANDKSAIYDKGTTNIYNALNLSCAWLFQLFKHSKVKDFSGIGFGVNNLFGTRQVFGYNYSYDGKNKVAVTQPATRSIYIGFFMSLGIDMRDDFINENL